MTTQHDKPKRWRPRFSVRTLVVVVTLVCCYAACWGPTKRQGVDDVLATAYTADVLPYNANVIRGEMIAPLLIATDERERPTFYDDEGMPFFVDVDLPRKCYYFWFFGYVAQLPYEREI